MTDTQQKTPQSLTASAAPIAVRIPPQVEPLTRDEILHRSLLRARRLARA